MTKHEGFSALRAMLPGTANWYDSLTPELAQSIVDAAVAAERERCAQIIENLVRATDGVDALAAIRGEENLTARRSWLRRNG
jgi:(2Fe-2S) ferredoxin